MAKVRNVLGAMAWNAHGLEFLSPLARAFGPVLQEHGTLLPGNVEPEQQVLDLILSALDPSALLEGHVQDNNLSALVQFPERGYLEIAKGLFDENKLLELRLAAYFY